MKDRPGPFEKRITVYTNERTLRRVLTIKGEVIPRPERLNVLFRKSTAQQEGENLQLSSGKRKANQAKRLRNPFPSLSISSTIFHP